MAKNKKLKKNNEKKKTILLILFIIFSGVLAVFSSIILSNSEVSLRKINFKIVDNIIMDTAKKLNPNMISKRHDNEIKRLEHKNSNNDKKKELEIIRGEVEKSKLVTKEKEKNTTDVQVQAANKRLALIKIHGGLKNAYSQVESPKEKQMLSIMLSTVSKLEANPSYDFKVNQAFIKSIYSKLDSDSQSDIKFAIFCNVDGDSISLLKKSFGL